MNLFFWEEDYKLKDNLLLLFRIYLILTVEWAIKYFQ